MKTFTAQNFTELLSCVLLLCFAPRVHAQLEIGVNLHRFTDFSPEVPFVDIFKGARPWQTRNIVWVEGGSNPENSGLIDSIATDENGYPLELPYFHEGLGLDTTQAVHTLLVREIFGNYPAGEYICLYDGTGNIAFGFGAQIVSQTPGRIVLNVVPSHEGIRLLITESQQGDHIRNIRILMPETEETYQSEPFNPAFLDKVRPFKTIRFMDWMATNNSKETTWEERRLPSYYTQSSADDTMEAKNRKSMAFEYMIDLCNTLDAAPWFCIPHRADSTYIANFAQLVKDSLDPNLKIYLEYSNEAWNPGFQQHHWVRANGDQALNDPQKYAKFAKRVFDIWREVFAGEENRIIRVAACQLGTEWIAEQIMAYLGSGGADALSPSAYFGFLPAQYDTLVALGASATPEEVLRLGRASIRGANAASWRAHYAIAQQYGLEMIHYEGGQHLTIDNPYGEAPPFLQAIYDAQIHPCMYQVYNELLDSLCATGSKLFMAYSLASPRKSKFGSWGHLEHVYQNISEAPKYKALIDAINPTGVSERENRDLQLRDFHLEQNYPNPFNPETTIRYQIPKTTHVRLEIFDVLGRKIVALMDQKQPAGNHVVKWNGKNAVGQNVASGVYLYRLQANNLVQMKKLALLR